MVYHREPIKEWEVCLALLCDVDADIISQRYNVPVQMMEQAIEQTMKRSIDTSIDTKRHPREWHDELADFYRQTPAEDRLWNSAHLYLAVRGKDVASKELARSLRYSPVYQIVDTVIYTPQIEEIERRTRLSDYLRSDIGIGKLLRAVNSEWRESASLIKKLLIERLHQEYMGETHFSLDSVTRDVAGTITDKVAQGGLDFTPKKAGLVNGVLATLREREIYLLSSRYGLAGEQLKTFRECGENIGLSGQRAREIEQKALQKVRHPSRARGLEFAAGLVTDEDVDIYQQRLKEEKESRQYQVQLAREQREQQLSVYDGMPISTLELSRRSSNCLASARIDTVGELLRKSEKELLKIKSFGRKSLREIKEILDDMGAELLE